VRLARANVRSGPARGRAGPPPCWPGHRSPAELAALYADYGKDAVTSSFDQWTEIEADIAAGNDGNQHPHAGPARTGGPARPATNRLERGAPDMTMPQSMPTPIPTPPHNHKTAQAEITLELPDDTHVQVGVYLFTDGIMGLPVTQRWPGHCGAIGTVHLVHEGRPSEALHRFSYLPKIVRVLLARAGMPADYTGGVITIRPNTYHGTAEAEVEFADPDDLVPELENALAEAGWTLHLNTARSDKIGLAVPRGLYYAADTSVKPQPAPAPRGLVYGAPVSARRDGLDEHVFPADPQWPGGLELKLRDDRMVEIHVPGATATLEALRSYGPKKGKREPGCYALLWFEPREG
jgi:hypothetical protein